MSVGASDTAEEHEADGVADAVMQRVAQRHADDNDDPRFGLIDAVGCTIEVQVPPPAPWWSRFSQWFARWRLNHGQTRSRRPSWFATPR